MVCGVSADYLNQHPVLAAAGRTLIVAILLGWSCA
jgi:hypothetical protein